MANPSLSTATHSVNVFAYLGVKKNSTEHGNGSRFELNKDDTNTMAYYGFLLADTTPTTHVLGHELGIPSANSKCKKLLNKVTLALAFIKSAYAYVNDTFVQDSKISGMINLLLLPDQKEKKVQAKQILESIEKLLKDMQKIVDCLFSLKENESALIVETTILGIVAKTYTSASLLQHISAEDKNKIKQNSEKNALFLPKASEIVIGTSCKIHMVKVENQPNETKKPKKLSFVERLSAVRTEIDHMENQINEANERRKKDSAYTTIPSCEYDDTQPSSSSEQPKITYTSALDGSLA